MDPLTCVRLAALAAVDLVASEPVARRWTEPSVLGGYRIGGLAAHLIRGIETIRTYAEGPSPDGKPVDAGAYFAAVLGAHDPHTSQRHAEVRARGESQVDRGPTALLDAAIGALAWLDAWRPEPGQRLAVLDGTVISVDDYLDTRLIELLVHSDDLALSIDVAPPILPDEVWMRAVPVLAEAAALRHSPRSAVLYLARPERAARAGAFDAPAPDR